MPETAGTRWKCALAAPLLPFAALAAGLFVLRLVIAVDADLGHRYFTLLSLGGLAIGLAAGGLCLARLLDGATLILKVTVPVLYLGVMVPLLLLFSFYVTCTLGIDCL